MRWVPSGRTRWLAALALGLVILGVLLRTIGLGGLADAARAARPAVVALALLFFVPQIAVGACRWRVIARTLRPISFLDAVQMVLAAGALNVLLPSKLGDLSKGVMLAGEGGLKVSQGMGLAAFERVLDAVGLALVLVVAGCFARRSEAWVLSFWLAAAGALAVVLVLLNVVAPVRSEPRAKLLAHLCRAFNAAVEVRRRRNAWTAALALSVTLWMLHVAQISLFYRAVRSAAPVVDVWFRVPIALFVGQLPITVAGVGTRDGALQLLMAPWDPAAAIALLGLFCTFRYVVVALLGVPAIISFGATPRLARPARSPTATHAHTEADDGTGE
jgi:hypothetical protein